MLRRTFTYHHPTLGSINGKPRGELIKFLNIPYGEIPQRFARASLVERLPRASQNQPCDATNIPSASIQPLDSGTMDCKGNQFPLNIMDGYKEDQSELCLRINITMPKFTEPNSSLPVLVFVHGGTFFIGSSTRPYYDPTTLCSEVLESGSPHIFISINYRLGGLGFFHSPEANDLIPANNGLHDQRIAFDWIRRFIGGFGGDESNITAMGQSAGGMSITAHNLSGKDNVWKRSIQFSGSLVTMPVKSPEQHRENFIAQAKKFGLNTERPSELIAKEMIDLPVQQIRDSGYVGMLCHSTELLPYEDASMARMSRRRQAYFHQQCPTKFPNSSPSTAPSNGTSSQIVSSTTYDGGISYNLLISNTSRKGHAERFTAIANSVLSHPQELLDLYSISPSDSDDASTLRKICQFESDIGFFVASLSQARGFVGKSYLLLFGLGNPFEGHLPARECATHTWDIVALLGAMDERLDEAYRSVTRDFRAMVLRYVATGEEPWEAWTEEEGKAMVVGQEGLRVVGREEYMGNETRRGKLLALAERGGGEAGADLLWDRVCRQFLMDG